MPLQMGTGANGAMRQMLGWNAFRHDMTELAGTLLQCPIFSSACLHAITMVPFASFSSSRQVMAQREWACMLKQLVQAEDATALFARC